LLGIAIAQKRGLGFKNFKCLHSVAIHHVAQKFGGLLQKLQVCVFCCCCSFFLPSFQVGQVVTETAKKLFELGGPDVRASVEELKNRCWKLVTDHTGNYGEPTPSS